MPESRFGEGCSTLPKSSSSVDLEDFCFFFFFFLRGCVESQINE
jgi:hypothetical protein